jgi:hypothetical protein
MEEQKINDIGVKQINNPIEVKSDKVLIVKNKRGKMNVKVRRRAQGFYSPDEYFKSLNPQDYNDLALLFEDLELIFGSPIDRAFRKYKDKRRDGYSFFG